MKYLTQTDINLVSGGECVEMYNADVPLNYLPIVAKHLKLLNKHKFDSNVMLQELIDAGLDPSLVTLNVGVICHKS